MCWYQTADQRGWMECHRVVCKKTWVGLCFDQPYLSQIILFSFFSGDCCSQGWCWEKPCFLSLSVRLRVHAWDVLEQTTREIAPMLSLFAQRSRSMYGWGIVNNSSTFLSSHNPAYVGDDVNAECVCLLVFCFFYRKCLCKNYFCMCRLLLNYRYHRAWQVCTVCASWGTCVELALLSSDMPGMPWPSILLRICALKIKANRKEKGVEKGILF